MPASAGFNTSGSEAMQLAIRATPLGRHAVVHVGPLPIDAVDIDETAQAFIDYCRSAQRHAAERPLYSTSVNGHVISLCARDRRLTQRSRSPT